MSLNLSTRIAYERKKAGLTQEQLANKIYLSRSSLGKFEKGLTIPIKNNLQIIAKSLSIPSDCFEEIAIDNDLEITLQRLYNFSISDNPEPLSVSKLLQLEKTRSNFLQEISARFLLAAYYYSQHQVKKGDGISDTAITAFLDLVNVKDLPCDLKKYYYLYGGVKNYANGKFTESLSFFESLIIEATNEKERYLLLLKIININFKRGSYAHTFTLVNGFIETIKNADEFILLTKAYLILSAVMINLQLYNEALAILEKAEVLINKHEINDKKIAVFQQRGRILFKQGFFQKALTCYEKASNYPTNAKDLFLINNSLVATHMALSQFKKAREVLTFIKSLTLSEYEQMIVLSYEGELALYDGNEKLHWKYQNQAIHYFKTHHYNQNLSYIYTVLAKYYLSQNKYKEASTYYHKKELLNENNY